MFDPAIFEAEATLKLIPTEQLPAHAVEAVEAGFDGPAVLRMAVLSSGDLWEIDKALPPMLTELGCGGIPPREAGLLLAARRAKRILDSGEDPLASLPYFHSLMVDADYPDELQELGWFDDIDDWDELSLPGKARKQTAAREALEELLSPAVRERKCADREAAWAQSQAQAKTEWPYVLHCPSGWRAFRDRCQADLSRLFPTRWIGGLRVAILYAILPWRRALAATCLLAFAAVIVFMLAEYSAHRRHRRALLLDRGVPEAQL